MQGRVVLSRDAGGYLTYTEFDPATGAQNGQIDDVNTGDVNVAGESLPGEASALTATGLSTPSGGGANLVTTDTVDIYGRVIEEIDPLDRATFTVYDDVNHAQRMYTGWLYNPNTGTFAAGPGVLPPTQVTIDDWTTGATVSLTMSAQPAVGASGQPIGTEPIAALQSLSVDGTNLAGQATESDSYFGLTGVSVTASGGVSGGVVWSRPGVGNYYRSLTGYDMEGRVAREVSQAGTVTRTVYDGLDRTTGVYVGTVDALGWSPTTLGNLVQTESDVYDFGGVGDSDLTQRTMFSGTSAEPNQVMQYAYDWRDRQVGEKDGAATSLALETDGVHRSITITTYDNLGEVTETQTFDGDGVALTNAANMLQVPAANLLRGMSESLYDLQGQEYQTSVYSVSEAAQTAGQVGMTPLVSDMWYDSRGEQIAMDPAGGSWTKDVFNGLGEVIDEYQTDGAGGNPGSVSGDTVLSQVVTSYDADQEATEVTSTNYGSINQVDYSGTYYDASGRDVAMVDVGNNGGVAWTMPATVPARSTSTHVTSYGYNWQGEQSRVTDPSGLISRTRFDALGRTLRTVEDAGGSANGSDGSGPQNKTTSYTYGPAGETSLTAVDNGVGQTTQYVYGVSPGNGSTMYSRDVMRVTEYPNPTSGQPSAATNEEVSSTVDNLGQPLTTTDRNGNVHAYTYDSLGRETLDSVQTLGSGVDPAVQSIGTAYDSQGNPYLATSYNGSGAVVNQVEDLYDGFGQLVQEYQAVGGAVVGNTPSVQYTYSEGMNNSDRLTSMVYPDGYQIDSVYNSGTDSAVSRVSSWADDQTVDGNSTTLESYGYLGVGEVLSRTDQAQTQTVTLDPFGRVGTEAWTTSAGTTSSYTYTYDADSNVLTKTDNVNSSLSQTYQYDGLNQVTSYAEASGTQSQSYTYDSLGNRTGVATNGSSSGTWSANAQNEITNVGTTGSAPIYDADGNMTADQTGLVYTYDAWNRWVKVSSSAGTLETMSYDGLSRLVVDTNAGVPTNRYYSLADQVLDEQSGGLYTARYVWSEVYVNALVFRDTNASGLSATSSYTRVWAQQDANYNVMALVNASGAVVARFDYTAFGVLSTVSGGVTNWVYGFQGMRVDGVTNWLESQTRWYSPSLGVWTSVDPLGFGGGDVREYGFVGNNPCNATDPNGFEEEKQIETIDGSDAELKDHTFDFNKGTGAVYVRSNATIKNRAGEKLSNWIEIRFVASGDLPADTHWLQFCWRQTFNAEGKVVDGSYPVLIEGQKIWWTKGEKGRGVDCGKLPGERVLPFYDTTSTSTRRTNKELTIFDRPSIAPIMNLPKQEWHFDDYLVSGGKVYYHVQWTFTGTLVDNEWIPGYSNITGEPAKTLPDWAKQDKLRGGFFPDSKDDPGEPVEYPNPIPKENR